MAQFVELAATPRDKTGKGAARQIRFQKKVPAVIYGHGRPSQPLELDAKALEMALIGIEPASTIIELTLEGKKSRTLIREIQRHPVKRNLVHLDFQELVAGEKVTVSVPLRFTGVADGVRNGGGILEETMHQVHLRLDPSSIPDHIDVDVTPLTIGHSIHIRELTLPEGVTVLDDANATVCVCTAPKAVVEEVVAPEAEAGVVAEPELIRKAKPEDEEEAK